MTRAEPSHLRVITTKASKPDTWRAEFNAEWVIIKDGTKYVCDANLFSTEKCQDCPPLGSEGAALGVLSTLIEGKFNEQKVSSRLETWKSLVPNSNP